MKNNIKNGIKFGEQRNFFAQWTLNFFLHFFWFSAHRMARFFLPFWVLRFLQLVPKTLELKTLIFFFLRPFFLDRRNKKRKNVVENNVANWMRVRRYFILNSVQNAISSFRFDRHAEMIDLRENVSIFYFDPKSVILNWINWNCFLWTIQLSYGEVFSMWE